jgi:hypothetical protein
LKYQMFLILYLLYFSPLILFSFLFTFFRTPAILF